MKNLPTSSSDEKITFIKLARKTRQHWLWKASRKKTKFEAWLDLLFRANFEESKEPFGNDLITLKRGDLLCSQEGLAKDWGWDRSAVRHFLKVLEGDGMLTVKVTNKFTVITLCNYATYNDKQPAKDQQDNNNATSTQHQAPTYKNKENNKNGNKVFTKPPLEEVIEYFLEKESAEDEAEAFYDHYEGNGWKIGGKAPMQDWKASSRTWIRNSVKWGKAQAPTKQLSVLKAVRINERDQVVYENGKIYGAPNWNDIEEVKAGRKPLSALDRKVS